MNYASMLPICYMFTQHWGNTDPLGCYAVNRMGPRTVCAHNAVLAGLWPGHKL